MIYDINGSQLLSAYDIDGTSLQQAYDINGCVVFTKTPPTIKVMDYNVGQWYYGGHVVVPADKDAEYYALQNGMIQRADPDILCLEEYLTQFSASGRSALTMLQQYFPYIHEEKGTGTVSTGKGRCICSKYPISNYVAHQYTSSGEPRYYDTCTITIGEKPVTVVVTHLNYNANSNTDRLAQMNELITYLGTQTRFIACGDYNMLDCKSVEGADYTNMMLPILNAGFHAANCTDFGFLITYSDQPSGTYTGCLDNIVTSSNIQITNALVDTSKLTDSIADKTDHMPLIAELAIN